MKLQELMIAPALLEGVKLEIYEELLPLLILEDGEGGGGDGGGDFGGEVDVGGDDRDEPVRTGPFVGNGGGRWFMALYTSIKNLVVSSNIVKRMKELGISPEGRSRVQAAAKSAAKSVNNLLSNPKATTNRIPVWTFDKPNTPKIKRWNEGFAHEFKSELSKLNENQILD